MYFTEDNNGTEEPRITGTDLGNTPINVSVYVQNKTTISIPSLSLQLGDYNSTGEVDYNGSRVFTKYTKTDLNEYYFITYDLNPLSTSVDIPLDVNLSISGLEQLLGSNNLEMCNPSGVAMDYYPSSGLFNVVHNDYSPAYNIPTQVVKREGDFTILSIAFFYLLTSVYIR